MNSNSRLYTLDYLRGLAALGIMIYHCMTWGLGTFPIDSFMGKVGVYGVSIFYILSGLTLYYVYSERMKPSSTDLTEFYFKRVFRIYPLLWMTIFFSILLHPEARPNITYLTLNLTGAFGLIRWDGYIGTGVWSIGNELVFYLFFPVFILLCRKSKAAFYIFSAILLSIFLYFAFYRLNPSQELSVHEQWVLYINPLNQVFLFLSGYLIGYLFTNIKFPPVASTLLFLAAFLTFVFYSPIETNLSAGFNRIILSSLCFLICLAFYKNILRLPVFADRMLTWLGEASYSVYLLHPIVWFTLLKVFKVLSIDPAPVVTISSTIVITLIVGYFNYKYFESYFIRAGRTLYKKLNINKKKEEVVYQ